MDKDTEIGKITKDIINDFHLTIKRDRKKYCKEHGNVCETCDKECDVKFDKDV